MMDRRFRDAWVTNGDAITVDMDKARALHRDNLRQDRVAMLADLDVLFMRALENGQPTASIVAQKQALRNAPNDPCIDAAQKPEALQALDLTNLTSRHA